MKLQIPYNSENFLNRGKTISFSTRTLQPAVSLLVSICSLPLLFFTVNWQLLPFCALCHVACVWMRDCYYTVHRTAISVNAIPITPHALCSIGCIALQLCVQGGRRKVDTARSSCLFRIDTYIKATQKRHHLIHISSLILHLKMGIPKTRHWALVVQRLSVLAYSMYIHTHTYLHTYIPTCITFFF
jgi:hypothetical protein